MRSFLHILKKIGKIVLIIPIFALLYFLSAWIMASLPLNEDQPKGEITLFLVSNGVHTDVVMPLKNDIFDWSDVVNPKDTLTANPQITHIGLGWGERNFYLYTPTLIHVTYYPFEPRENSHVVKFMVTPEQYRNLTKSLLAGFQQENGQPILLKGVHHQSNDAFYEAKGRYHLFNTCNTWLNDKLVKSGLKGVYWTPFSSPLLEQYR